MELPQEYAGQINDLCELSNVAEVDLKNVGRIKDVLIVTGVNQLRYAGQHLVRALTSQDQERIPANLDAATRHAQRAIYDINDSAVQFYLVRIDQLREKQFPRVDFAATIPNYGDLVETIRRARASLEVTEQSQHDRAQFYSRSQTWELHPAQRLARARRSCRFGRRPVRFPPAVALVQHPPGAAIRATPSSGVADPSRDSQEHSAARQ